ncbi:MAG: hypothetical protein ACPGWR_05260 [Ardenticatenaceae bacterium]
MAKSTKPCDAFALFSPRGAKVSSPVRKAGREELPFAPPGSKMQVYREK